MNSKEICVIFILCLNIHQISGATFKILEQQGLTPAEQDEAVELAHKVKSYAYNWMELVDHLSIDLERRHGEDFSCMVNRGPFHATLFFFEKYIYLESEFEDYMFILCFKTPYRLGLRTWKAKIYRGEV